MLVYALATGLAKHARAAGPQARKIRAESAGAHSVSAGVLRRARTLVAGNPRAKRKCNFWQRERAAKGPSQKQHGPRPPPKGRAENWATSALVAPGMATCASAQAPGAPSVRPLFGMQGQA
eukprot:15475149-Alexandrium_andersonii.AAC.1